MRLRLMIFAALVAACIAPAKAQLATEPPVDAPPPPVMGAIRMHECISPKCLIVNGGDLQRFLDTHERLAQELDAVRAELLKLKGSCVARLTIPPDETRKRS